MTVNFGDLRSAFHSGGELPKDWMDDERARGYVAAHVREVGLVARMDDHLDARDIELMCGGTLVEALTGDEAYAAMSSARYLVVVLAWHHARLPLGHIRNLTFDRMDCMMRSSAEQTCVMLTNLRMRLLQREASFSTLPEYARELIIGMLQNDPYSAIRLINTRLISTPSMKDHAMMHIANECAERITKDSRPAWTGSLEQQPSLIHYEARDFRRRILNPR